MSDTLWPHGLHHSRLPVHHQLPDLAQTHVHWTGDAIQPFNPLLSPSPPAFNLSQHQGLFQESVLPIRGQSTRASTSASVLPKNIQDWFPFGWTGWISLQSKGLSESSPTPPFKRIHFSVLSFHYSPTLTSIHDYWKNQSLTRWIFIGKVMSLLFNMLYRLVITFLPRSKPLLIS